MRRPLPLLLGAACIATPALAQQTPAPTPAPAPAPAPPPRRPTVITMPGAEGFDLRPSGQQATPAPSPAPAPAPTVTPPPIAAPSPTRAAPTPRPAPTPTRAPVETAPAPTPTPVASPTALPTPLALPTPAARAPTTTSAPAPTASAPARESLPWTAILGVLVVGAAGIGMWLWGRRRPRPKRRPERATAPRPAPVPAVPRAAPPPPPPSPAPVVAPSGEPIEILFRPVRLDLLRDGVVLEYELLVGNPGPGALEDARVTLALASASPHQDEVSHAFHFAPPVAPAAPPFMLDAGKHGRLVGRLPMGQDQIHVVQIGGRPAFVPLVLINTRWRGGLSLRRHAADFMVGIAGQGDRPGPVWLDRGAVGLTQLAATRYFRKAAVQAAE